VNKAFDIVTVFLDNVLAQAEDIERHVRCCSRRPIGRRQA
jgi:hypothetical protein